jgi:transcriptional regulator with XRE-family HTH domain
MIMDQNVTSPPGGSDEGEAARLGERLKGVREYLEYSQQLVSERTGIPRSAVSDIERGVRKVDSLELKKLARLYSYPMAYFLDVDDDAEVGTHAIQAMARALTPLDDLERQQVMEFAKFLKLRKAGQLEAENDEPPEQP